MFSKKTNACLLFATFLICIVSFLIPILTHALGLTLWAQCEVGHPWWAVWTSQIRAKASVSWSHPKWFGDMFLVHAHNGRFSCHARVGANEPKKVENVPFAVSSLMGAVNKSYEETDWGYPRWDGDAYASSAISEYNNPTNWKFCSSDGSSSF